MYVSCWALLDFSRQFSFCGRHRSVSEWLIIAKTVCSVSQAYDPATQFLGGSATSVGLGLLRVGSGAPHVETMLVYERAMFRSECDQYCNESKPACSPVGFDLTTGTKRFPGLLYCIYIRKFSSLKRRGPRKTQNFLRTCDIFPVFWGSCCSKLDFGF